MVQTQLAIVDTLAWEDVRRFLMRREWLRSLVEAHVFEAIRDRETSELDDRLLRDLSLWISGYMTSRGTGKVWNKQEGEAT